MRTITQGHERQQRPVMFNSGILAIFQANPRFNLRTPRMVEVDDTDKRRERSRGGQGRHHAVKQDMREVSRVESKPCARLAIPKSAGRGGVGGDDGSSALSI